MTNKAADRLAITLAQLNPTMGDVEGNAARAREARARAAAEGADLIVFSELFICGYPPEDLVLKPALQAACRAAIEALARETADGGPAMLIGTPWVDGGKLYNACALLDGGRIAAIRYKVNLPNYGVFDEKRVFARGPVAGPVTLKGVRIGVPICEDIWTDESAAYENIVECLAETGAEILIVPNGSPYSRDKDDVRINVAVARVTESASAADLRQPARRAGRTGVRRRIVRAERRPFAGSATAGVRGEPDHLAVDAHGRMAGAATARSRRSSTATRATTPPACWACATMCARTAFPACCSVCRAASNSALCAAIAVDALGAERVRGVMLPFRFTAQMSLDDAAELSTSLGIRHDVLPIADAVNGIEASLGAIFEGRARDIAEENIQARARGTILMAISNKFNLMVVTTGNKSEMSVGYATLYGDMNGGFNPIKDIYKTEVFRLSILAQHLEA